MRTAFIQELVHQAEKNPNTWLLCADIGFSVLEAFEKKFPKRFVNVGVAEQNMASIATGLAATGKNVFIYSIANFPTLRCLEQIRNDICYHKANVKIVSVGAGFAYGSLGYTHFAVEDMGIMRTLPNLLVISPADPCEAKKAVECLAAHPGPAYLRLGKANEPVLHEEDFEWRKGQGIRIRNGKDLTMIATGSILKVALETRELLLQSGAEAAVVSCPFIKPFDTKLILEEAQRTGFLVSLEEHGIGGLFSCIAETLAEASLPVTYLPYLLKEPNTGRGGSQKFLLGKFGLEPSKIAENILKTLARV